MTPEPWDQKEVTWLDKLFVKDNVRSFLHIPLNFGKVMVRNMGILDREGARDPRTLILSHEESIWGTMSISRPEKGPSGKNGEDVGNILERGL